MQRVHREFPRDAATHPLPHDHVRVRKCGHNMATLGQYGPVIGEWVMVAPYSSGGTGYPYDARAAPIMGNTLIGYCCIVMSLRRSLRQCAAIAGKRQ
jgi:hypothetical protein